MMTPKRIGLASRVGAVSLADLTRVAAAINLQVSRDFRPIWDIEATVAALPDPDAIPPGVWPIFIVDDTGYAGAAGLHLTGANQPYALVEMGKTWSLTVSHECVEMLVDPSGNKLQTSTGIEVVDGEIRDMPGVKFEYLVEVADPAEDARNAYMIDDVLVSDFYTPAFFDPVPAQSVRYSYTGRIQAPRQILPGGYVSWYDPQMRRMRQLRYFGQPQIVTLPGRPQESTRRSLRGYVDSQTPPPERLSHADTATAAGGYGEDRRQWLQKAANLNAAEFTALARRAPAVAAPATSDIAAIIAQNKAALMVEGVTRAYPGWHFENGWITHDRAIVVLCRRTDVETVRATVPATLGGLRVEVRVDPRPPRRPAGATMAFAALSGTVREELALPSMPGELLAASEVPSDDEVELFAAPKKTKPQINYAAPAGVTLDAFEADMTLRLHVSPDRGWPELRDFLTPPAAEMVVGMYQCTAPHIETALKQGLGAAGKLTLTMDSPPDGKSREQTVEDTETHLDADLGNRLDFAWALSGLGSEAPGREFPTAYHIKVAVRDGQTTWVSSGNWNTANQPQVDPADEAGLIKAARECDRDWHVICDCPELAGVFRAYLLNDNAVAEQAADAAAQAALTGALMAAANTPAVDPLAGLMAPKPKQFFDTRVITRKVKIQPLLTPDPGGYRAPIIELIKSAKTRFYMQTQYIHTVDAKDDTDTPKHMDLIAAVADAIKAGVDVKLITSEYQDFTWIERLQDSGIDCVSHLRLQQRVHNKGIIVDSQVCVVSSQNWSGDGTGGNRDAGLIIHDAEAADYFETIFVHDWANMAVAHVPGT